MGHYVPYHHLEVLWWISTRKFCDAGCKVVFDIQECRVYFNKQLVLTGSRDPINHLWRLPINPTPPESATNVVAQQNLQLLPKQSINHVAHHVHTLPYLKNQVKFMHQTFFCPPKHTLIKAINNQQLSGIPFMQAHLIRNIWATRQPQPKGECADQGKGCEAREPRSRRWEEAKERLIKPSVKK